MLARLRNWLFDGGGAENLPERVLKKFGAAVGHGAIKAAVEAAKPSLR